MTDNMHIWDAVSKTDPSHTKQVSQRGGFTAIDAQYQIMNATRQFGPIGVGWGYDANDPIFYEGFVIVPVTLWHGSRGNTFGPVYGCAQMLGNRPDADAPKKAGTDALTKLLSQLGFNADVFLGKFDDNKYVAERRREEAEKDKPQFTDAQKRDTLKGLLEKQTTKQLVNATWANPKFDAAYHSLPESMQLELQTVKNARMEAVPDDPAMQAPATQDPANGHVYQ